MIIYIYNIFIQTFCRFGCPAVIISDQGREFVNSVTDELFIKTKTKHCITSAYNPQVFLIMV